MVEVLSKFGTYVNDQLIIKGTAMFVHHNDIIRLFNVALRVRQKNGNEE
jgi:hypothetical protein